MCAVILYINDDTLRVVYHIRKIDKINYISNTQMVKQIIKKNCGRI